MSKKLFLYFSRNKEVYDQTKDLLEAEIPKLRARHGLRDFIIHSDVGEFQSDKIRVLVRSYGGEIEKGSAYTPEHSCFIERSWRTIKEMASTMIIAAGLSEPYWECAQAYAALIYNRTVRPVEGGEMKSPDDIYYGVLHDMMQYNICGANRHNAIFVMIETIVGQGHDLDQLAPSLLLNMYLLRRGAHFQSLLRHNADDYVWSNSEDEPKAGCVDWEMLQAYCWPFESMTITLLAARRGPPQRRCPSRRPR